MSLWTVASCFAELYVFRRSCKFEALYSILIEGHLRASSGEVVGERVLQNAPEAVYVHSLKEKAENYVCYVHLFRDHAFGVACGK